MLPCAQPKWVPIKNFKKQQQKSGRRKSNNKCWNTQMKELKKNLWPPPEKCFTLDMTLWLHIYIYTNHKPIIWWAAWSLSLFLDQTCINLIRVPPYGCCAILCAVSSASAHISHKTHCNIINLMLNCFSGLSMYLTGNLGVTQLTHLLTQMHTNEGIIHKQIYLSISTNSDINGGHSL